MADNVELDAGSGGAIVATDDDGTAHHQYVKVEWGADNTQTKVSTGASALPIQDGGNTITVDGTVGVSGTVTVDGSGVTQPVSAASLPLPTGAATAAKQPALGTAGSASADVLTVQGIASMTPLLVNASGNAVPVTDNSGSITVDNGGTFAVQAAQSGTWNITNVSGTVSLPTGASTAAKQPALGTAGSASADVLTVQGVTSMTPLDVNIVSGAGSGGTAAADDADFTAGTTSGTPAMGVYESTPTSVTDGDLGTVGITQGRRLKTSATIDAALPAGTNAIGKLAANSGVDIGDVDVTSCALPTGASTSANQSTIIGHLDGVEGLLTTIDADTGTVAGAVSGTEMQVDVVGALPAGTNNIGDVDVASIAAGDNNIGNVDIVTVPAPLSTTGGGTEAAALRVTIANNSTGVLSVDDNGSTLSIDDGAGSITVDNGGTFAVQAAQSGTWTVQPGNTANTTPWLVTPAPATSGGLSIFRSLDIDETEEDVKTSAGQVFGWYIHNAHASSTRYIKFYNATAANVTVGTTTPVLTFPLGAGATANQSFEHGIAFGTAISVAATTGVADNDTGAPGANEVIINVFYK